MLNNDFAHMSIEKLLSPNQYTCACGKTHKTDIHRVEIGEGAMSQLGAMLSEFGVTKPFIFYDKNTYLAAGESVERALDGVGMTYVRYLLQGDAIEPDEHSVGEVVMNFDSSCDGLVAVGGGTLNDVGKIVSKISKLPYVIVGSAPSMDGYASNSSSMISHGIKVTLYSRSADGILCDLDVVKNAPMPMLLAGFGDILAKIISITEWQISHIITGEYYCDQVADMMRAAVIACKKAASGLVQREPSAVKAVTRGLILAGLAMGYAEVSRPASGLEHYFSHIWDMYALEKGTPCALHGIQVGIGTVITLKIYEWLRMQTPSQEVALLSVANFDELAWRENVHRIFGATANTIFEIERLTGKHDRQKHSQRLEVILDKWPELVDLMNALPSSAEVERLLKDMGAPTTPEEIHLSHADMLDALDGSMDIRDKYIASRLLWDLGLLEKCKEML